MKQQSVLLLSAASVMLALAACTKETALPGTAAATQPLTPATERTVTSAEFTAGTLGTTAVVPISNLKTTGGSLSGNPILVDNMPEKVTSQGWLMSPPRIGTTRQAISGNADYYTFHFNGTGAQAYYVLLATNPQSTTSTISTQGVLLTKDEVGGFSFDGGAYFIERESYDVADRFMNNNFNVNATQNIPGLGSGSPNNVIITYKAVGNGSGIDGRFKMQVTGQAFLYSVMVIKGATETITQMLNRAVNLATTDNGSAADASKRANGEWQDANGYIVETSNTAPAGTSLYRYGRECGLYSRSGWLVNNDVQLPAGTAYMGMCLLTDQKKVPTVYPEDQTAAATALTQVDDRRYPAIAGWTNASRSYGNFGHLYDVTLNVKNSSTTLVRNVRLSLAYNAPDLSKPNAVFVGAVKVRVGTAAETTVQVLNRFKEPKKALSTFTVPVASGATPGNTTVRVRFYVPGLISAGHQLLVETLN